MMFAWNQIKKRTFEIPVHKYSKIKQQEVKGNETVTLSKKDYGEMIRSIFKLMIGGVSGNRMKTIKHIQQKQLATGSFQ